MAKDGRMLRGGAWREGEEEAYMIQSSRAWGVISETENRWGAGLGEKLEEPEGCTPGTRGWVCHVDRAPSSGSQLWPG